MRSLVPTSSTTTTTELQRTSEPGPVPKSGYNEDEIGHLHQRMESIGEEDSDIVQRLNKVIFDNDEGGSWCKDCFQVAAAAGTHDRHSREFVAQQFNDYVSGPPPINTRAMHTT